MALRIGAILLASCQLISGAVISLDNINNVHLNPIRSIEEHSKHRNQANSHALPVVGNLKWTSPRQDSRRQHDSAKIILRHQASSEYHSPQPSVVVSNYVIGQNAVKPHHVEVKSNHIDVNQNPVIFNNLRYIDYNQEDGHAAKTPITVVIVPEISTAKTTLHKVGPNEVINQSNIPSVKDQKNAKAVQLLYNYNDYSSTSFYPLTDVPEFKKTPIPNIVQSELVKPGKLQKVVAAQLAVGQRNENAPIVINQFLTTKTIGLGH